MISRGSFLNGFEDPGRESATGKLEESVWTIFLPCVCSFYVRRQEQSHAVEQSVSVLSREAGGRRCCSEIMLASRCMCPLQALSWSPAEHGRCTGPSPSGQQAGEEPTSRESAFDVASSLLPPNFFPLQNLLANFKGLLASCLNPVH